VQRSAVSQSCRHVAFSAHNAQETPLLAKSIEKKVLAKRPAK
jgi:hypothetical protein